MKVSLSWLGKYVKVPSSTTELAQRLTMAGLEVEDIADLAEAFRGFVIGRVRDVQRHPSADRLTVCLVDTGDQVRQVICGAPNVAVGQSVIVGLPGAVVPHNQHDPEGKPFTLSDAKIRGVDSHGMICSEYELGIGEDRDGIVVLKEELEPGAALATYLSAEDIILDIGITPNRPDALSHIGIAREVGVLWKRQVRLPKVRVPELKEPATNVLNVKIQDPDACPRYSARVIRGITVAPSPGWLQAALKNVGIRPVNNVVDITNYVLMEYGHPLHAFDYDRLGGKAIVVRNARRGEKFVTLDHKERELRNDTLLICDADRPVAIGGVMGGENSEITASTTTVVVESAYFDPRSIRRTSKHFGLSTDASQRFERGADPNGTVAALDRAAYLLCTLCGGRSYRGVIDVYPKRIKPAVLSISLEEMNAFLGATLDEKAVYDILRRLSFAPKRKLVRGKKMIVCSVPTYRPDITQSVDLVEEVARVYGYDKIPEQKSSQLHFSDVPPVQSFEEGLREWLIGNGYNEMVNNSMQDVETASLTSANVVKIANPISRDMAALRTSLVPGALGVVRHNIFHGTKDIRMFEFGRVYYCGESTGRSSFERYSERSILLLIWSNHADSGAWDRKAREFDIFDAKGEIALLAGKISLDNLNFIPYCTTDALTQAGLRIEINGVKAGTVGQIAKKMLDRYEVEQDVFVAELFVDVLEKERKGRKRYQPLPKFPVVYRDVAFVVAEGIDHETLRKAIEGAGAPYLYSVSLFDYYTGTQTGEGKKSFAFSLTFMPTDHTLTQDEIGRSMQKLIDHVSQSLGAHIRQ